MQSYNINITHLSNILQVNVKIQQTYYFKHKYEIKEKLNCKPCVYLFFFLYWNMHYNLRLARVFFNHKHEL